MGFICTSVQFSKQYSSHACTRFDQEVPGYFTYSRLKLSLYKAHKSKVAGYGSSPGRGLSPTSSSSAQPGALLIPELKAGIYLGESASESEGRPRPLWRETIIRAGRGGGYGSSSVSSVRGTCRAGGRPAEKTNRCFFFLLLLLLPHRNTHKHPTGGPSYRGGIAAGPGTNPPVGGGVPPCGLVVSEQNADRKCSCRNDSLRRRQTLTTTPSSPLHFRHRRCRRHLGSRPRPRRTTPRPGGPGPAAGGGGSPWRPSPRQSGCGWCLLLSILRSGVFAAARAAPALPGPYVPGGRPERGPSSVVVVGVRGAQARPGSQARLAGPAR
ncbi:uncharacterized protein LOC132027490 [Mustela nigripes]|uniref:uncharacterized protein LOC132027490 n=1 Tax=Mustela nigripes TaxID=77151 RepID=UPI0028168AD6|nr:uncharacterized protein LOC132027490 [Mustela nigripes]